jgi:hypothetical protein
MSTPQSIPHATPRSRIGLGTVLSALGALVAIAPRNAASGSRGLIGEGPKTPAALPADNKNDEPPERG